MGFFSFSRKPAPVRPAPVRKRAPRPKRAAPEPDQEPSAHYVLAHLALRTLALSNPVQFLAIMASGNGRDLIADLLAEIGKRIGKRMGKPPPFTADNVTIHCRRVGVFPCAVLKMPPPQEAAECHMVALVALMDVATESPTEWKRATPPARFFTLERGMHMGGQLRTVLCEWSDSAHSNLGDGPEPTVDAFIQALVGRLP